jgi:hypothetical protein
MKIATSWQNYLIYWMGHTFLEMTRFCSEVIRANLSDIEEVLCLNNVPGPTCCDASPHAWLYLAYPAQNALQTPFGELDAQSGPSEEPGDEDQASGADELSQLCKIAVLSCIHFLEEQSIASMCKMIR